MNEKYVATVNHTVQIGPNKYRRQYHSRIFAISLPMSIVLAWAAAVLDRKDAVSINEIQFSEYTGESM